ncbi:MAG TPA: hypothetical protein VE053_16050 [Allosphingosinicella sp.]|nr:hypothetical protein [Allosphingosinicella sp.]
MSGESSFQRWATIANLVITTVLTMIALVFSYSYNEREHRRDVEQQKYEFSKDKAAAMRSCIETDIGLAKGVNVANNKPLRIAMIRSIEHHVVECHKIGHDVDRKEALALLDRMENQGTPAVVRKVEEARAAIQRTATAGPVTDRERAKAYESLSVGDLVSITAGDGGLTYFHTHIDNPSENELRKALGQGTVSNTSVDLTKD